ncbi:chromate transporter [Piscinibacter sakaiensis]|uniref:Chromate transport protein ChrA n=1 Tax=Piscinibacter sakaiensis TaxID=1547922 RepID=A0A0K8P321_PISS1|nr:chromate transporter [Piscinibacter sakaiensis]GAP37062.1 chromate transport protein ChrA [Piscinibacter sakaiensis]
MSSHALLQSLGSPLDAAQLAALFGHFALLSLLSVGGALTASPDMHRYLVGEQHWLSDAQFSASIAIGQAAPGPNVLFIAALGWQVAGPLGTLATMSGILLPSTVLVLAVSRYGAARRSSLPVRAFTTGMAPLTIGLLFAIGWLLAVPAAARPLDLLLVLGTVVAMMATRVSPIWLIAAGAAAGALAAR